MIRYVKAYLYKGSTVFINKSDLKNAKDEDFTEVTLLVPYKSIQEWSKEIELID